MGSPVLFATLLSVVLYVTSIQTQDLKDQDVLCNTNSCLVLYLQRKVFLDAWRSCKSLGGNLVTIKGQEEAGMVESLFAKTDLRDGDRVRVWIGLQRQPRKCAANRPLRGFAWITGERETLYTNWQDEDSPTTCSVPRCVGVSYSTDAQELQNNLKWKDGPCSVPVDGYLCRYAFPAMCQPIMSEGDGNTLYNTPFQFVTAFLSQIPSGSLATVPCVTKGDQTVLCMQKEDGTVGWNREPPYCYDAPKTSWCDKDNGGCHHNCIDDGEDSYCDCNEGFLLAEDGMTCFQIDPCQGAPCEFECLAVMESYRCACPEGYMQAPDERSCVDVDECLQSPCEHMCINSLGSFECLCRDGYRPEEEGTCEDVDECAESPCEHACENVMGSHICHCHLGYAPLPEEPSRCHDIDECQIEGTCEQMCHNYIGGFECYCKEGYELQTDNSCAPTEDPTVTASYPFITQTDPVWQSNSEEYSWSEHPHWSQDWFLTVDVASTNVPWSNNGHQEKFEFTPPTENPPLIINVDQESFLPSATTAVPDYYEDESTTDPTAPPTTTVGGGASTRPTPEVLNKVQTTDSPFIVLGNRDSYDPDPEIDSITSEPELQTTNYKGNLTQDSSNAEKTEGSSWLLIGLLVTLCVFVVVVAAVLGIVYCLRGTPKPQNKKATDCYHWIAGAGDKAAADMAGGKV